MLTFAEFIRERHDIYLRRQAGQEKPWTDDEALQKYRFCNVYRELDTVTIWLREHWREPYADHENLWLAMAIARLINWPPSLAEFGFPETFDDAYVARAVGAMQARRARGEKVYTGAYITRADDNPSKPVYTFEIVQDLYDSRHTAPFHDGTALTLQETHAWFMSFSGLGGFMAYEIVTDLRHTRYLRDALDIYTWANAGPGALRGLNRLAGRPLKQPLRQRQACAEMYALLGPTSEATGLALEMRDIEHALCEYHKYLRVTLGQGRPRTNYAGV